jgi:hypothetical protein
MANSQRITIQSQAEATIWLKCILPVMLLGGTLLIFGKNALTWRFIFVIPSILLVFFFSSLAIVRISNGTVRYKRFFGWAAIGANEVVDSGLVWPGLIGYIRLNRRVRPWGTLYIILDPSSSSNPFRRGEHALLKYLGRGLRPEVIEGSKSDTARGFSSHLSLLVAGSAGVLFSLIWRSLSDYSFSWSVLKAPFNSKQPLGIVLVRLLHLLGALQVTSILFVIFVFLAVYRRRRPKSWTFAFLAGVLLPQVLFLWFTR